MENSMNKMPSEVADSPRDEHLWNFATESLGHFAVSDIGDALHGEGDVDRIATGEVVTNRLDHQTHQLTASGNKHRYKQISLKTPYHTQQWHHNRWYQSNEYWSTYARGRVLTPSKPSSIFSPAGVPQFSRIHNNIKLGASNFTSPNKRQTEMLRRMARNPNTVSRPISTYYDPSERLKVPHPKMSQPNLGKKPPSLPPHLLLIFSRRFLQHPVYSLSLLCCKWRHSSSTWLASPTK